MEIITPSEITAVIRLTLADAKAIEGALYESISIIENSTAKSNYPKLGHVVNLMNEFTGIIDRLREIDVAVDELGGE